MFILLKHLYFVLNENEIDNKDETIKKNLLNIKSN